MDGPERHDDRSAAIRTWIAAHEDDFVRLVSDLVRAESPSTDPASQGPVFDLVEAALAPAGFECARTAGTETGGWLTARPAKGEGAAPYQLLVGHVDTVWPIGTLASMPLVVEGGRLRGPGCFDMKAGVAQMVLALRALHALELRPEVVPVVFLNSDEEIGSPESDAAIRDAASGADRALVLEPALAPGGRIKTTRRGTGHFRVRIIGKGAHTGLAPEEGASAIAELAEVIRTLHGLTDRERGVEVNVGQVRGGVRPNVVAPEAHAVVDVRVRTAEALSVKAKLLAIPARVDHVVAGSSDRRFCRQVLTDEIMEALQEIATKSIDIDTVFPGDAESEGADGLGAAAKPKAKRVGTGKRKNTGRQRKAG